jgi:hypothetical protein
VYSDDISAADMTLGHIIGRTRARIFITYTYKLHTLHNLITTVNNNRCSIRNRIVRNGDAADDENQTRRGDLDAG